MRYAIVSDVHSNLESLQCVLARLEPGDALVSLGDVVGYGPNPNECVAALRDRSAQAVLGNHDLAAVENFGVEHFNPAARSAIAWTQGVLNDESRTWLNALPYELRFPEFLLVHGAPVNYFEYILEKSAAARAFQSTDAPPFSSGTRTSPSIGCSLPAARWRTSTCSAAASCVSKRESATSWTSAASGSRATSIPIRVRPVRSRRRPRQWVRYTYPIAEVQQKMRAAGLPPYLIDRLSVGR